MRQRGDDAFLFMHCSYTMCGLTVSDPDSKSFRKASGNVSNLLKENAIEDRKCITEHHVSNHGNSQTGVPTVYCFPCKAFLPTSLPHSSFPFPAILILLSDFEMLIWMSGSSLR